MKFATVFTLIVSKIIAFLPMVAAQDCPTGLVALCCTDITVPVIRDTLTHAGKNDFCSNLLPSKLTKKSVVNPPGAAPPERGQVLECCESYDWNSSGLLPPLAKPCNGLGAWTPLYAVALILRHLQSQKGRLNEYQGISHRHIVQNLPIGFAFRVTDDAVVYGCMKIEW
ncbi:hypothetical protein BKA70DRAFT_1222363 [Coprinopsis sp. MPI-PUGE-AT-0042]|nr:hypothetical protein BKA70DRAFT_1222363 [Coprinopsis sp. MPI-PUGE-AT-0042]